MTIGSLVLESLKLAYFCVQNGGWRQMDFIHDFAQSKLSYHVTYNLNQ